MELTTAMLADGAHQAANGKLYILGGQWDRLTVPSFPAQHPSLAIVLVFRVEYSEALDRHQIDLELTLDGQARDPRAAAELVTGHAPGQVRGTPSFVPLALTFNNLLFEAPGRYEWVVRADGEVCGRVPIEVVQGALATVPRIPGNPWPPGMPPRN